MSSQQLRAIRATGKWALVQKGSSRPLGFVVQFVVNVLQGASDFTVIGLCAAAAFITWRVAGTVEGGSE